MKNGKRIAAFTLSLVVALGSVCYRPPKAEAVVVESALASAAISTYLSATGFEFFGGGMNNTEINEAIHGELCELTKAFAESIDQLNDEVTTVITSGVTWTENGVVKFSAAAANMLGRFSDWLIDKLGLIAGGDSVDVFTDSGYITTDGVKISIPTASSYDYCPDATVLSLDTVYHFSNGSSFSMSSAGRFDSEWLTNGGSDSYWLYPAGVLDAGSFDSWQLIRYSGNPYYFTAILLKDGVKFKSGNMGVDAFNFWGSISLSTSIPADYEAAPDVDEQYAMVVNTGMTFADEQSYIDAILGGVAAGTLSPTYTIESTTAGDVTVPGEDAEDDTQVGLLGRIANGIESLADTILDGLASLFAPDPALMTEITDTFSAKFDFISDLHGLGTDLLNLNPDQTPPVIYIHLEDAEGSIVYGGTEKALDMSWYARYKEDVDRIMSGFLWLGFLWLVFKRASAIIQGAEMAGDYQADIDQGYRFRGERNGKRF